MRQPQPERPDVTLPQLQSRAGGTFAAQGEKGAEQQRGPAEPIRRGDRQRLGRECGGVDTAARKAGSPRTVQAEVRLLFGFSIFKLNI